MRDTPENPRVVSVLLLREPVSVLQGTDAYHDAFGSFCLPSYSLSALESGASTPHTPATQVHSPDSDRARSPVFERINPLSHNPFQDKTYLMTHHSAPDDDTREYWVVSFPILSHGLQNISSLADRILGAVEGRHSYDGVIITSKRAVHAWIEACRQVASTMQMRPDSGLDSERIWAEVPYYVVGPATAKSLTSAPLAPLLQPKEIVGASDTGTGAALAKNMTERFANQKVERKQRLLYLVGSNHSLTLQETLEQLGAPVELDELCVYTTEKNTRFESHCRLLSTELPRLDGIPIPGKNSANSISRQLGLTLTEIESEDPNAIPLQGSSAHATTYENGTHPDWVVFFSPSGGDYALPELRARNWLPQREGGEKAHTSKIACIGTTTATWVRERLGTEPDAIAASPTPVALRDAIVKVQKAL